MILAFSGSLVLSGLRPSKTGFSQQANLSADSEQRSAMQSRRQLLSVLICLRSSDPLGYKVQRQFPCFPHPKIPKSSRIPYILGIKIALNPERLFNLSRICAPAPVLGYFPPRSFIAERGMWIVASSSCWYTKLIHSRDAFLACVRSVQADTVLQSLQESKKNAIIELLF
jgi:hypothetical protein